MIFDKLLFIKTDSEKIVVSTIANFTTVSTTVFIESVFTYLSTLIQFLGCDYGELVGNGHCNDETNNADCIYDGGDCCGGLIIGTSCEYFVSIS